MKPFQHLLSLFLFVLPLVLRGPDLGIQQDPNVHPGTGAELPKDAFQSYSGIIQFEDASIPGDKKKLSDGQLINLAKIAYDEMVAIWQSLQLSPDACPGAMAVTESDGYVLFASSVRMIAGFVDLKDINADEKESPGWFMTACLSDGMGPHRLRGRCAEPNVLRLYGDYAKTAGHNQYVAPTRTSSSPRLAVWGRPDNAQPLQDKEQYFLPCSDTNSGWGCNVFQLRYGFKPAAKVTRDPNGENDWKFSKVPNPRALACAVPQPDQPGQPGQQ